MIKVLNLEWTNVITMDSDEEFHRVLNIIEDEKYRNIFKYDGDEGILFKEKDKNEVEKFLGIKTDSAISLSSFLDCFSDGQSMQLGEKYLSIRRCIDEVQHDIEKYEERIWNAVDVNKEINQILKEQVKIVYEKELKEERNRIDNIINGDFEW
jgi:hypothetical protein